MFSGTERSKFLNRELLDEALSHLAAAGVRAEVLPAGPDAGSGGHSALAVRIPTVTGPVVYDVQVSARVTPSAAALIVTPPADHPQLVITRHVTETVADQWRRRGVQFADTAGNMYLRRDGLLLDVRGRRRPPLPPVEGGKPLRTFQPRGLAVVFTLLCRPEMAGASYRELSRMSRCSLGSVQAVMAELTSLGHLQPTAAGRQLHRTHDLFRRWVEAYALVLHPRLDVAILEAPDPNWWITTHGELRRENAQWGGETAAHLLDPHLRPANTVIYADDVPTRLLAKHRLRAAKATGNVRIRRRFWDFPSTGPRESPSVHNAGSCEQGQPFTRDLLVPSPLVFADLLASGDPRLHDAALRLREKDDLLQRLDLS